MPEGTDRVCEACGETFQTLTKLRLHEKDDCPGRNTFANIDPAEQDAVPAAAASALSCTACGRQNAGADYEQTPSLAGGDYRLIIEFECTACGFENDNHLVMEGIDPSDVDQLPPHLRPADTERDRDV